MRGFQKRILVVMLFVVAAGLPPLFTMQCAAQETSDWNAETLSGDWGGARTRASQRGVNWEIVYTADMLADVSGGVSRGAAMMGNIDIKSLIDMDKYAGWHGSRIFIHVIGNHGGKINERVGSAMGVDNIEVATNGGKLFQAWIEQRFLKNKLSVLGGLYSVDSEFNVNEASDVFLNPAFGMSPEFSQTGRNGPSIYPTASVGTRVRFQPNPAVYAQAALLDSVSGDPNNPHGTHIRLRRGDGTLLVTEIGFNPSRTEQLLDATRRRRAVLHPGLSRQQLRVRPISKVAAGFWRYSESFDDLVDVNAAGRPVPRRSFGGYVLAEETLFQERDHPEQGLAAFISYGVASADANAVDYSVVTGLRYLVLFTGQDPCHGTIPGGQGVRYG